MKTFLIVLLLFVVLVQGVTVYEDGSWRLGDYPSVITGCLPDNECSASTIDSLTQIVVFPHMIVIRFKLEVLRFGLY